MGEKIEFDEQKKPKQTKKARKKKPPLPTEWDDWKFSISSDGLYVNKTRLTDVAMAVHARWKHVQSKADLRFTPKMGVYVDFFESGDVVTTEQVAYDDLTTDDQLMKLLENLGYSCSIVGLFERYTFAKVVRHFLKKARPPKTYRIHTRSGWSDNQMFFVAGPELIPDTSPLDRGDRKQSISMRPSSGTVNEWIKHVATPLVTQRHAAYQWAVSLPLGALLMPLVGFPANSRGGFHVYGPSTTGKSKMLDLACSVLGDEPKTWETTSSKLEIVASEYNNRLLCLDEIGQAKKSEVVESAYKLAQGVGKSRTNQNLENIEPFTFELTFLSTGESSYADVVRKELGEEPAAGQKIRFCDIEWDSSITKWWDTTDLRNLEDSIRDYYGAVGREFISILAASKTKTELTKQYRDIRNRLIGNEDNAKFARVANRFALAIQGATLAKEFGLLPDDWDPVWGPTEVFKSWKLSNGALDERVEAAKTLLAAIQKGRASSKFHRKIEGECALKAVAYDRDVLGFLESPGAEFDDTTCYLFPEEFRRLIGGKNMNSTRAYLAKEGALLKSKRGYTKRMGRVTFAGSTIASEKTNVYHIDLAALTSITSPQESACLPTNEESTSSLRSTPKNFTSSASSTDFQAQEKRRQSELFDREKPSGSTRKAGR